MTMKRLHSTIINPNAHALHRCFCESLNEKVPLLAFTGSGVPSGDMNRMLLPLRLQTSAGDLFK